jgi:hypothetical protein
MLGIRFLESWNGYDRGAEVPAFPHTGLAEDLIRMRIAEEITSAPVSPTPETGTGIPAAPTPAVPAEPPKRPGKLKK